MIFTIILLIFFIRFLMFLLFIPQKIIFLKRLLCFLFVMALFFLTACASSENKQNNSDGFTYFSNCKRADTCVFGIFSQGELYSYIILDKVNGLTIEERLRQENKNYSDISYYENGDTSSVRVYNTQDSLIYNRDFYRNGNAKKIILRNNSDLDTSYYLQDGQSIRYKEEYKGDTLCSTELDSIGNLYVEKILYQSKVLEKKIYENDSLVLYIKGDGDNADTLIHKMSSKIRYRKASEIMAVVQENISSLQSIYNHYLKSSKFNSKIKIRMAINPQGNIAYLLPVSYTPNTPLDFINDIIKAISTWTFEAVDKNTIATIPFTFFE